MDKLLDLVKKVRESVIPAADIKKMNKKDLLSFIEDAKILEKMQIFHEKKKEKQLKSIVHEVEEEGIVPDLPALRKMSVGKYEDYYASFTAILALSRNTPKCLRVNCAHSCAATNTRKCCTVMTTCHSLRTKTKKRKRRRNQRSKRRDMNESNPSPVL